MPLPAPPVELPEPRGPGNGAQLCSLELRNLHRQRQIVHLRVGY